MTVKERMIEKVPLKKRKRIIWLYLEGMSYQEISCETNVAKAAVSRIISKLRTGQYLEFAGLSEQVKMLRKLTLKLRQLRLEPRSITGKGGEVIS